MALMRTKQRLSLLEVGFCLHVFLVLSFDYVPEIIRLAVAAALFLIYGVGGFRYSRARPAYYTYCMFMLSVLIMAWYVSYSFVREVQTNPDVSLSEAVRELAPLFAMIAYVVSAARIRHETLLFGCTVLLTSAIGHALFQPSIYLPPSFRLAPFTSGLHTSAYIIVSIFIGLWNVRLNGRIFKVARLMMWGACLFLVIGYGVRTAQVLLFVYFIFEFFRIVVLPNIGIKLFLSLLIYLFMIAIPVFVTVMYFSFGFEQLSDFTSGRLANYMQRFELIGGRGSLELLFGTGPGSDKLVTDVWWWEEKDSHNDLIHLLWIGGAVSLCALFGLLYATWKIEKRRFSAFVVALLVTSASSNALLARPNASFLFFAAMAVSVSRPLRNSFAVQAAYVLPSGQPLDASPVNVGERQRS